MVDNTTGPIIKGGAGLHLVPPSPSKAHAISPEERDKHVAKMQTDAWQRRMVKPLAERLLPFTLDLPSNWYQTEDERREPVWERVADEDAISVDVMRLPLSWLYEQGRIPDALTPIVREFIDQIEAKDPDGATDRIVSEFNENPTETYEKWLAIVQAVWLGTVTRPTFVAAGQPADPQLGIYSVADLDYYDMLYVYSWTQGVDQSVRDFLQFQSAAMGALGAKSGVLGDAGPVVRIQQRGGAVVDVSDQPGGVEVGSVHRGEAERDDREGGSEG